MGVKPIAELLLNAGAAINVTSKRGETPLHVAVRYDMPEVAALLLARKADPNAKDIEGQTPLHFAVANGQSAMATLLLANQADPNERNNSGLTPLDLAKSQREAGIATGLDVVRAETRLANQQVQLAQAVAVIDVISPLATVTGENECFAVALMWQATHGPSVPVLLLLSVPTLPWALSESLA